MKGSFQFKLAILAAGLCCLPVDAAPKPAVSNPELPNGGLNSLERERLQQIAREQQERFRKRVALPSEATESEIKLASLAGATGAPKPAIRFHPTAEAYAQARQIVWLATAAMLAGLLAFRRYAPEITAALNQKFNPWALSPAIARRLASQARAEEACFQEFLAAFRIGLPAPAPAASPADPRTDPESSFPDAIVIDAPPDKPTPSDFFAKAPQRLAALQKLLGEIRQTKPATPAQRELLEEFGRQVGDLKNLADFPELLPARQMTSALEGLIKQFISKASYVTASTLRTAGISLDLLQELCVPGLPANLATDPPIRLLTVDDDPITRHALSWSLSQALSRPDVAENGDAALALAAKESYDVIFLDVQMPGMDGFELCSRIHETEANRITPVVFVTGESDFNARAESALCGGVDLIAKPFLTFEITIVALTLVLRRRLQERRANAGAATETGASPPATAATRRAHETQRPVPEFCRRGSEMALRGNAPPSPNPSAKVAPGDAAPALSEGRTNDPAKALLAQIQTNVRQYQEMARLIRLLQDTTERQEQLEDLELFIHSLSLNAQAAGLPPAFKLSNALEGLLKKLVEKPAKVTEPALQTIVSAVDLLVDLCAADVNAKLDSDPPIRLLVVDDDPIARRAVGGALQMVFGKPDLAENGTAALACAMEQAYDVIFLDVMMPDMDGFSLCPRIHDTSANAGTPVIFVTSHNDPELAAESALCGGSDFVNKSFLVAEINLKALVYALRHRLQPPAEDPPQTEMTAT